MNDEEKELIEKIQKGNKIGIYELIRTFKKEGIENFITVRRKYIDIMINLIEKQQKEIQDLIINQCIYQDTSSCTRSISLKMYTELNNYISKDKLKPIQIIDLNGKIHNVYKIEEE